MSDYYLADLKAKEREHQQTSAPEARKPLPQEVKVQLLGDFIAVSHEPTGADPYNSTQGKAAREAWHSRRHRR
jgi:hypothetical protein